MKRDAVYIFVEKWVNNNGKKRQNSACRLRCLLRLLCILDVLRQHKRLDERVQRAVHVFRIRWNEMVLYRSRYDSCMFKKHPPGSWFDIA